MARRASERADDLKRRFSHLEERSPRSYLGVVDRVPDVAHRAAAAREGSAQTRIVLLVRAEIPRILAANVNANDIIASLGLL